MNHHFSEVIKIVLKTLDISAHQLAPLIDVKYDTLNNWIKQKQEPPLSRKFLYIERLKRLVREEMKSV